MSECVRWANPENLPAVALPYEVTDPEQAARIHEHAAFITNAYPDWLRNDKDSRHLRRAATLVMASALDTVDTQFGRHAHDSPGPQYLADPWGSFPTFYHGGDGTRLALLGCIDYMAYVTAVEGDSSPYRDVETYFASLMTVPFDDLVFGLGRGKDEAMSALTAERTLDLWPYDFSERFVKSVRVGVEESLFDEKAFTQGTGAIHAEYRPVLMASQASDLWILFLESRPQYAMRLGIENLYKADTAAMHGQILMHKARERNFVGKNIFEFLEFIGSDEELIRAYGQFVYDSAEFGGVDGQHSFKFSDDRLNTGRVFRQARRWNSHILCDLGEDIMAGIITPINAYRFTAGSLYSKFGSGSASHALSPVYERRDRLFPAYMQTIYEQGWDIQKIPGSLVH